MIIEQVGDYKCIRKLHEVITQGNTKCCQKQSLVVIQKKRKGTYISSLEVNLTPLGEELATDKLIRKKGEPDRGIRSVLRANMTSPAGHSSLHPPRAVAVDVYLLPLRPLREYPRHHPRVGVHRQFRQ